MQRPEAEIIEPLTHRQPSFIASMTEAVAPDDDLVVPPPADEDETQEPALFTLIRSGSVEAVQWYLDRFPLGELPSSREYTALTLSVACCFESAESWQDENDNQEMEDALSILCRVAALSDLTTVEGNKTIFHRVAAAGSGRSTRALVSSAITECLLESKSAVQNSTVVWVRDKDGDTPLHTAVRAHNFHTAAVLLEYMVLETPEYEDYSIFTEEAAQPLPLLQFSLQNHVSSKFLSFVLEEFETAVETWYDGNSPLITALEYCYPLRKLRLLVEAAPRLLGIATGDGDLPLHLAALYYSNNEVLSYLAENLPAAISTENCHGQWPLHCAMECREFSTAVLQLDTVKVLCGDKTLEALCKCDSYGEMALHLACRRLDALDVVEWLIEEHPDALRVKNHYGHLPLHLASAPAHIPDVTTAVRIVQALVDAYPEALQTPDQDGDLPLHVGVVGDIPPVMLDNLMQPDPDGTLTKNQQNGQWPLHTACESGASVAVLRRLMDTYPQVQEYFDPAGRLPVHLALSKEYPVEVLQQQLLPKSSTLPKTKDGRPSLLVAAEMDSSLDVLRYLVERSPELFATVS